MIERPEYNPNELNKYSNIESVIDTEVRRGQIYPFESEKSIALAKEKLQKMDELKKTFKPEVKKEDRLWVIVKERNRKV